MIGRLTTLLSGRRCDGPRFFAKGLRVSVKDALALLEHHGVFANLCQTDGSIDVSHIGLHAHSHDVVTPTSRLALGEGIFRLTVQTLHAQFAVELFIIEGCRHVQTNSSTFSRRNVLDGMQREDADVSLRA